MIVERKVDDCTVAQPPNVSMTKEQRRLINYWKLRLTFAGHCDKVAAERLSKAFQNANAVNEERSYWTEAENTEVREDMLTALFVRTRDFNGLYRLCRSEDFQGSIPWAVLKELRARHHEQNNQLEFISLSRIALKRHPWDNGSAKILVEESGALTRLEDRINTLKSGLDSLKNTDEYLQRYHDAAHFGRESQRSLIVEELENLILEQGNDEYVITFWQSMVRKMPDSWYVGNALQEAFRMQGKDAEAVVFWSRVKKIWPAWPHSDYFYAESCQEVGDLEEAIKVWFIWLEFILTKVRENANECKVHVELAAKSLQRALLFNHEPWDVISIWEKSLRRFPARRQFGQPDIRQQYIASTFLEAPELQSVSNSCEIIQKVACLCAYDNQIVRVLRMNFERNHLEELEEKFWMSHNWEFQCIPGAEAWYNLRLAQFHSFRRDYIQARVVLSQSFPTTIDESWLREIAIIDLAVDTRDFWWQQVHYRPWNVNSAKVFEAICQDSQQPLWKHDVQIWPELVWKYSSYTHLIPPLERMFERQRKREPQTLRQQVDFWKIYVSSFHQARAECYLANSFKTWRKQLSKFESTKAFEEEIEFWCHLLCYSHRDDESLWVIVQYLDLALTAKADTVGDQEVQRLTQIWTDARDSIWNVGFHAHSELPFRSAHITSQIQKYWEDAGAILQLLEADQ